MIKEKKSIHALLIGEWTMNIPESEKGKMNISLFDDYKMEINVQLPLQEPLNDSIIIKQLLSARIGGTWSEQGDSLKFFHNPALTDIDIDIDIEGANAETKNALMTLIKRELETQKEEVVMQLLKANFLATPLSIDSLTETHLILNGNSLSKVRQVVIGSIEGETGYLVEKGYQGSFVVLEWCDWNCTMSVDEYETEFKKQKDKAKHIVLLSVESDENGYDVFQNIIEIKCPSMLLGLRVQVKEINSSYYERTILNRYMNWLESGNRGRTNLKKRRKSL